MKFKKTLIYLLLTLSLVHLIIMIYYSVTSEHAYIVANFPQSIEKIELIYLPVILTILPGCIFLFDLIVNKQKNWFVFFINFISNLSLTIFIIGSLLFGGH
jgi:hypothetical protein